MNKQLAVTKMASIEANTTWSIYPTIPLEWSRGKGSTIMAAEIALKYVYGGNVNYQRACVMQFAGIVVKLMYFS